jgi:hypothetical protein
MMMNAKLSANFLESVLTCPACGCDNLHQTKTEIFGKRHVTVESNGWADTDDNMKNHPCQGYDAVMIGFWCEGCSNKSVLSIYQYKGNTYLMSGVINETISYDAKS